MPIDKIVRDENEFSRLGSLATKADIDNNLNKIDDKINELANYLEEKKVESLQLALQDMPAGSLLTVNEEHKIIPKKLTLNDLDLEKFKTLQVEKVIAHLVSDGVLNTANFEDECATTEKIADGAITTAKLQSGCATTEKIADEAITTAKLQSGCATTEKIADEAITTAKLANEFRLSASAITGLYSPHYYLQKNQAIIITPSVNNASLIVEIYINTKSAEYNLELKINKSAVNVQPIICAFSPTNKKMTYICEVPSEQFIIGLTTSSPNVFNACSAECFFASVATE